MRPHLHDIISEIFRNRHNDIIMEKQKEITLKNKKISYILKKNRRSRYMRLSVSPDASVRVSVPWGFDEAAVEKFLIEKAEWLLGKLSFFKNKNSIVPSGDRKDYLKNKELARQIAETKLRYFNNFYGFDWKNVSIRNQKTRWGSCSGKGNLNFSYRIVYLGEEICDYIIVHELCHLREFNHSKKFWALVGKAVPDYKKIRKRLKAL